MTISAARGASRQRVAGRSGAREGPASIGKIALFAVGIALVLGAVFYGLNNTSVQRGQTAPPAQTAQTQPAIRRQPLRACAT